MIMGYFSHGYAGGAKRNKSGGEMVARLVVIAVIMVLFNKWFLKNDSGTSPQGQREGSAEAVAPTDEQKAVISRDLLPATRPALVDGIAVMILSDTSGSMKGKVDGPGGGKIVKLDAAKRAVNELIETTARLKTERLKLPVLLGVYDFSQRGEQGVRQVIALAPPDPAGARVAIEKMTPEGGTPIGVALARAKRDLDETGLSRQHIIIVTDGENTAGYPPAAVLAVMRSDEKGVPASVYFVAFDIEADKFNTVRDAGADVLPAADSTALQQTLDSVLTEHILVE